MPLLQTWDTIRCKLWKHVAIKSIGTPWVTQTVTRITRWVEWKVAILHALASCTDCAFLSDMKTDRDTYLCDKNHLRISDIGYWICPDHEFKGWLDKHLDSYISWLAEYALTRFPEEYSPWTEKDVLRITLIESCKENPEFVDLYFQEIYSKIF